VNLERRPVDVLRDPQRVQADQSVSVRAQRILGEPFMAVWDDPAVRELYVNSDGRVWADRAGAGRVATGLVLEEVAVLRFLAGIAAYRKETLTAETPALQGAMPDERFHGARIQGYIPPRAPGPGFNLRKHNPEVCRLESYLERGALGFAEYDLLLESVDARRNVLVAGATRSGKTTFLGGLIAAISERWPADRLLVVEDTPEIRCTSADAVLYRTLPGEPMGPVIAREAMRLSPDRIVCGEFRDRAAYYCADLWTSGHNGGAASMHAGSVEGALMRMNLLMLDGRRGSYAALVAEAVDVVVVLARGDDGGRVVDLALLDGLDRRGRFQIRRPQLGANRRDVC
jgi:type IV secretion system protein VirB11